MEWVVDNKVRAQMGSFFLERTWKERNQKYIPKRIPVYTLFLERRIIEEEYRKKGKRKVRPKLP